jgi:Domain of Unknown Function (DUF1080)
MKCTHPIFILLVSLSGFARGAEASSANNTPPTGFSALWNGRDLTGWWGADTEDPEKYMRLPPAELKTKQASSLAEIRKHWSVENGELVNDGEGLLLTTEESYGNFELLVDYKTAALADSGIYLRGYPQVQIWDSTDPSKFSIGADKGSGGLWNNSAGTLGKDPLVRADRPFAQWNHLRIIMVGSRVWVWLNDQPTVTGATLENHFDIKQPVLPRGPIQLQTHGGEIRWRNLFIRQIHSDEANERLRGSDTEGFKPIFNGKDLTGWAGPLDCAAVVDAALVWQAGKSGTIYTQEEFTNFVVRLEFKLPPGANNGLAIRYPGEGNPAYVGMCECQVLDDNYEQATGTKIDPRQAHGSAYGMVGAHRGFHHPVGEWNYQEVTVNGSTIRVELNGVKILDADLSKVSDFMSNSAHPGKNRTSGHFGLAGHDDPVTFRNISIKSLK